MNPIEVPLSESSPAHLLGLQSQKAAATLQGWKNVASELDRGVRTVQRWERDLGLPVHRVGSKPRCPVFAFAEELYRWLRETGDLPSYTHSAVVNHTLQEQSSHIHIVNRLREPNLGKDRLCYPQRRKTSKGRNVQAIIKFLAEESSRRPTGNCEQCHSPLRAVEGHFRLSATEQNWVIPIVFCPICDLETIGGLGAKQSADSHDSILKEVGRRPESVNRSNCDHP